MVSPYMEKVFDMVRTLDQLDWYGRSCHCDRLQALYPDLWHEVRVFFAPDEMRDGTKTAPTVANGEIIPLFDRERPMTWFDLYKARAPKAPPVPKKQRLRRRCICRLSGTWSRNREASPCRRPLSTIFQYNSRGHLDW